MADSLLDIGGEEIFAFNPVWDDKIHTEYAITRYLLAYRGTASRLSQQNEEVPISVMAKFVLLDKATEKSFLEFIHNCFGRVNRFWLKYPRQAIRVKDDIGNGSTRIDVYRDYSNLSFNGYERIYIITTDGDTITRHVTAATLDEANDEVQLTLATAMDRAILTTEIEESGRLLLVRFDDDNFIFKYDTDYHAEITQRFKEVVKDYDDLAANP